MATPRLPFLFPHLFKFSAEVNPAARSAAAAQRSRAFHASRPRQDEAPQPHEAGANGPPGSAGRHAMPPSYEGRPKYLPSIGRQDSDVNNRNASEKKQTPPPGDEKPESVLEAILLDPSAERKSASGGLSDADGHAQPPPIKAPHLDPPPYVHHFDTYGLVQRLIAGGWDRRQAISIMKAMRQMLSDSTDLATKALVSKSNLENETYLFRAACAELTTEVMRRRTREHEQMRTGRDQLQHEVEILSQRLGQETATLKDELKGLFDDRKMAVRNEQRDMESKIQQLNYRITVSLQADAKSEVEGLRMILTRRVILTLGLVVFMVVGSLKLFSDAKAEMDEAEKRRARMATASTQTFDFVDDCPSVLAKEAKVGSAREMILREGDANPSFVSLG